LGTDLPKDPDEAKAVGVAEVEARGGESAAPLRQGDLQPSPALALLSICSLRASDTRRPARASNICNIAAPPCALVKAIPDSAAARLVQRWGAAAFSAVGVVAGS
jgi:hypothetical protein